MFITILLSVLLASVIWAAPLLLQTRSGSRRGDQRGVALQTVIVIVVLLAIAGAVAGVLLTRGGEAVAEAERQEILVDASEITNEGLCKSYGFTWADNSCYRTVPAAPLASSFNNMGEDVCEGAVHLGQMLNYTWTDDPDDADPLIGTCA